MDNKDKKSKLVFDPRISRKLLQMNGEIKFCPYCGKALSENCECHKNIIIDLKKKRDTENETVIVFDNNENFKADYEIVSAEVNKKELENEQMVFEDWYEQ